MSYRIHTIMKKALILCSTLLLATFALAQDAPREKKSFEMRTLLGPDTEHGVFFAGSMYGTKIDDQDGILVGGKIGWVIDHWFTLGAAGMGLANPVYLDDNTGSDVSRGMRMGYGGLYFEPRILSEAPIHVSFPIIVGSGGANFTNSNEYYFNSQTNEWEPYEDEADAFFIVEPGVEIEINVARNFRLGLGGSYRYVEALNLQNIESDALNGFSAGFTIKLGVF